MTENGDQFRYSKSFINGYKQLPPSIQKKVDRQVRMLSQNFTHPSLRAKKMVHMGGIWEARVDVRYRITYERVEGIIRLRAVGRHDIYAHP